jgi:hypothetical protein
MAKLVTPMFSNKQVGLLFVPEGPNVYSTNVPKHPRSSGGAKYVFTSLFIALLWSERPPLWASEL